MSHSQFHSTNLFILRHAWLNLWDKHMTTGRINQVTTIHLLWYRALRLLLAAQRPLSQTGVHQTSRRINYSPTCASVKKDLLASGAATKTPCSPISQISSTLLLVTREQQRSWPSKRTTNNRSTKMSTAVVVDSQVVNCNRFSYQQVIHILLSLQALKRYLTW